VRVRVQTLAEYSSRRSSSLERATQTEESEIVSIKAIANDIQNLVKVSHCCRYLLLHIYLALSSMIKLKSKVSKRAA